MVCEEQLAERQNSDSIGVTKVGSQTRILAAKHLALRTWNSLGMEGKKKKQQKGV